MKHFTEIIPDISELKIVEAGLNQNQRHEPGYQSLRKAWRDYESHRHQSDSDSYASAWRLKYQLSQYRPEGEGIDGWADFARSNLSKIEQYLRVTSQVVPDKLHFALLTPPDTGQLNALKLWALLNPDYQTHIWYDSRAVLHSVVQRVFKEQAAMGVQPESRNNTPERLASRIIAFQDEFSHFVLERLASGQSYDNAAIDFLVERFELDRENLLRQRETSLSQFRQLSHNIQSPETSSSLRVEVHDVGELWQENALSDALGEKYHNDLALRGRAPALEGMVRAAVLKQHGGIFISARTLPQPSDLLLAQLYGRSIPLTESGSGSGFEMGAFINATDINATENRQAGNYSGSGTDSGSGVPEVTTSTIDLSGVKKNVLAESILSLGILHKLGTLHFFSGEDAGQPDAPEAGYSVLLNQLMLSRPEYAVRIKRIIRDLPSSPRESLQPLGSLSVFPGGVASAVYGTQPDSSLVAAAPQSGLVDEWIHQIQGSFRFIEEYQLGSIQTLQERKDKIPMLLNAVHNRALPEDRVLLANYRHDGLLPGYSASAELAGELITNRVLLQEYEQFFNTERVSFEWWRQPSLGAGRVPVAEEIATSQKVEKNAYQGMNLDVDQDGFAHRRIQSGAFSLDVHIDLNRSPSGSGRELSPVVLEQVLKVLVNAFTKAKVSGLLPDNLPRQADVTVSGRTDFPDSVYITDASKLFLSLSTRFLDENQPLFRKPGLEASLPEASSPSQRQHNRGMVKVLHLLGQAVNERVHPAEYWHEYFGNTARLRLIRNNPQTPPGGSGSGSGDGSEANFESSGSGEEPFVTETPQENRQLCHELYLKTLFPASPSPVSNRQLAVSRLAASSKLDFYAQTFAARVLGKEVLGKELSAETRLAWSAIHEGIDRLETLSGPEEYEATNIRAYRFSDQRRREEVVQHLRQQITQGDQSPLVAAPYPFEFGTVDVFIAKAADGRLKQIVADDASTSVYDVETGDLETVYDANDDLPPDTALPVRCERGTGGCSITGGGRPVDDVGEVGDITPEDFAGDLLRGDDAIEQSGVPADVVHAWSARARQEGFLLAARPVNPDAQDVIEFGVGGDIEIATKGLGVHGKSSDWGMQSGLIPYEAELSKKTGLQNQVDAGNQANQEAILKDEFNAIPLRVSRDYVDRRFNQGKLDQVETLSDDLIKATTHKMVNGQNVNFEYRLTRGADGLWDVEVKSGDYIDHDARFGSYRPLLVMAERGTDVNGQVADRLLTADIDLFALFKKTSDVAAHQFSDVVRQASRVQPQLSSEQGLDPGSIARQRWISAYDRIRHGLGQADRQEVDAVQGRITRYQRTIVEELNQDAQALGRPRLVQHGTEQDNNNFPEVDDKILFIDDQGNVIQTRNFAQADQLIRYYDLSEGYLTYTNKAYNYLDDPTRASRPGLIKALNGKEIVLSGRYNRQATTELIRRGSSGTVLDTPDYVPELQLDPPQVETPDGLHYQAFGNRYSVVEDSSGTLRLSVTPEGGKSSVPLQNTRVEIELGDYRGLGSPTQLQTDIDQVVDLFGTDNVFQEELLYFLGRAYGEEGAAAATEGLPIRLQIKPGLNLEQSEVDVVSNDAGEQSVVMKLGLQDTHGSGFKTIFSRTANDLYGLALAKSLQGTGSQDTLDTVQDIWQIDTPVLESDQFGLSSGLERTPFPESVDPLFQQLVTGGRHNLQFLDGSGNDFRTAISSLYNSDREAFTAAISRVIEHIEAHSEASSVNRFASALVETHDSLSGWNAQRQFRSAFREGDLETLQQLTRSSDQEISEELGGIQQRAQADSRAVIQSDGTVEGGNNGAAEVVFDEQGNAHFVLDPTEALDAPQGINLRFVINNEQGQSTYVFHPEDLQRTSYQVLTTNDTPPQRFLVAQDSQGENHFVVRSLGENENILPHLEQLVGEGEGLHGLIPNQQRVHGFFVEKNQVVVNNQVVEKSQLYVITRTRHILTTAELKWGGVTRGYKHPQEGTVFYVRKVNSQSIHDGVDSNSPYLGREQRLDPGSDTQFIPVAEDDKGRLYQIFENERGSFAASRVTPKGRVMEFGISGETREHRFVLSNNKLFHILSEDNVAGTYQLQEVTSKSVYGALDNVHSELGDISTAQVDSADIIRVQGSVGKPWLEVVGSVKGTTVLTQIDDSGRLTGAEASIKVWDQHHFATDGDQVYYSEVPLEAGVDADGQALTYPAQEVGSPARTFDPDYLRELPDSSRVRLTVGVDDSGQRTVSVGPDPDYQHTYDQPFEEHAIDDSLYSLLGPEESEYSLAGAPDSEILQIIENSDSDFVAVKSDTNNQGSDELFRQRVITNGDNPQDIVRNVQDTSTTFGVELSDNSAGNAVLLSEISTIATIDQTSQQASNYADIQNSVHNSDSSHFDGLLVNLDLSDSGYTGAHGKVSVYVSPEYFKSVNGDIDPGLEFVSSNIKTFMSDTQQGRIFGNALNHQTGQYRLESVGHLVDDGILDTNLGNGNVLPENHQEIPDSTNLLIVLKSGNGDSSAIPLDRFDAADGGSPSVLEVPMAKYQGLSPSQLSSERTGFMTGLAESAAQMEGRSPVAGFDFSTLEHQIRTELGEPPLTQPGIDLDLNDPTPARIGLEVEFGKYSVSNNVPDRTYLATTTNSVVKGIPLLSITRDGSNLELIGGPAIASSYNDHSDVAITIETFVQALDSTSSGAQGLSPVIDQYNRLLEANYPEKAHLLRIDFTEQKYEVANISLSGRKGGKVFTQTNIAFDYEKLSDPFSGIDQLLTGNNPSSRAILQSAQIQSHRLVGYMTQDLSSDVAAGVTPNLKSMLTQYLFQASFKGLQGDYQGTKIGLEGQIRTGTGEAISTILNDGEVAVLSQYRDRLGEADFVDVLKNSLNRISEDVYNQPAEQKFNLTKLNSAFESEAKELFIHTLDQRQAAGRIIFDDFSPDSNGKFITWPGTRKAVLLDMLNAPSRIEMSESEGHYYPVLEVRGITNPVNRLGMTGAENFKTTDDLAITGVLKLVQNQGAVGVDTDATNAWIENTIKSQHYAAPANKGIITEQLRQGLNGLSAKARGNIESALLKNSETPAASLQRLSSESLSTAQKPLVDTLIEHRLQDVAQNLQSSENLPVETADRFDALLALTDRTEFSVTVNDGGGGSNRIPVVFDNSLGAGDSGLQTEGTGRLLIGVRNDLRFDDAGTHYQQQGGGEGDQYLFNLRTGQAGETVLSKTSLGIDINDYRQLLAGKHLSNMQVQDDLNAVSDALGTGSGGFRVRLFRANADAGTSLTQTGGKGIRISLNPGDNLKQSSVAVSNDPDAPIVIRIGTADRGSQSVSVFNDAVDRLYGSALVKSFQGSDFNASRATAQQIWQISDSTILRTGSRIGLNGQHELVPLPENTDGLYHQLVRGAPHDLLILHGTSEDYGKGLNWLTQQEQTVKISNLAQTVDYIEQHPGQAGNSDLAKAYLDTLDNLPDPSSQQQFRTALGQRGARLFRDELPATDSRSRLRYTTIDTEIRLDGRAVSPEGNDGLTEVVTDSQGESYGILDPSEIDLPLPEGQRPSAVIQTRTSTGETSQHFMVTDGGGDFEQTEFILVRGSRLNRDAFLTFRANQQARCTRQGDGCGGSTDVVLDDGVDTEDTPQELVNNAKARMQTLDTSDVDQTVLVRRGGVLYRLEEGVTPGLRLIASEQVSDALSDSLLQSSPRVDYVAEPGDQLITVLQKTGTTEILQQIGVETDGRLTGWPISNNRVLANGESLTGSRNVIYQSGEPGSEHFALEVNSEGSPTGAVDTRLLIAEPSQTLHDLGRVTGVTQNIDLAATEPAPVGRIFEVTDQPEIAVYVSPEYQRQNPDFMDHVSGIKNLVSKALQTEVGELITDSLETGTVSRPAGIEDLTVSEILSPEDSTQLAIPGNTKILLAVDSESHSPATSVPTAWSSADASADGTFSIVQVNPRFSGAGIDTNSLSQSTGFMRELYQASEQVAGDYRVLSPSGLEGIENDFRGDLELPLLSDAPSGSPATDVTPQRIGFEEEFTAFKVLNDEGSSTYKERVVLAYSNAEDSGNPRVQLTVDKGLFGVDTRLEVIYGPRTTESYHSNDGQLPPHYRFRQALIETLTELSDSPENIDQFALTLKGKLGPELSDYWLDNVQEPDYQLESYSADQLEPLGASRTSHSVHTNIAIEYSRIGDPFSGLVDFAGNSELTRGLFAGAQLEGNRLANLITPNPGAYLKSLMTQAVHQELMHGLFPEGTAVKTSLPSLFRAGSADAVASILKSGDIDALNNYIRSSGRSTATLKAEIHRSIDTVSRQTFKQPAAERLRLIHTNRRLDDTFEQTLNARTRHGEPFLLDTDSGSNIRVSPADRSMVESGALNPPSRRPVYTDASGENAYTIIEIRENSNEISQILSSSPDVSHESGRLGLIQTLDSPGTSADAASTWLNNVQKAYQYADPESARNILSPQLRTAAAGFTAGELQQLETLFVEKLTNPDLLLTELNAGGRAGITNISEVLLEHHMQAAATQIESGSVSEGSLQSIQVLAEHAHTGEFTLHAQGSSIRVILREDMGVGFSYLRLGDRSIVLGTGGDWSPQSRGSAVTQLLQQAVAPRDDLAGTGLVTLRPRLGHDTFRLTEGSISVKSTITKLENLIRVSDQFERQGLNQEAGNIRQVVADSLDILDHQDLDSTEISEVLDSSPRALARRLSQIDRSHLPEPGNAEPTENNSDLIKLNRALDDVTDSVDNLLGSDEFKAALDKSTSQLTLENTVNSRLQLNNFIKDLQALVSAKSPVVVEAHDPVASNEFQSLMMKSIYEQIIQGNDFQESFDHVLNDLGRNPAYTDDIADLRLAFNNDEGFTDSVNSLNDDPSASVDGADYPPDSGEIVNPDPWEYLDFGDLGAEGQARADHSVPATRTSDHVQNVQRSSVSATQDFISGQVTFTGTVKASGLYQFITSNGYRTVRPLIGSIQSVIALGRAINSMVSLIKHGGKMDPVKLGLSGAGVALGITGAVLGGALGLNAGLAAALGFQNTLGLIGHVLSVGRTAGTIISGVAGGILIGIGVLASLTSIGLNSYALHESKKDGNDAQVTYYSVQIALDIAMGVAGTVAGILAFTGPIGLSVAAVMGGVLLLMSVVRQIVSAFVKPPEPNARQRFNAITQASSFIEFIDKLFETAQEEGFGLLEYRTDAEEQGVKNPYNDDLNAITYTVRKILQGIFGIKVLDGLNHDTTETGTDRDDLYRFTGDGNNNVNLGGGDDVAFLGAGNDIARGGTGDDRLYGELDFDELYGEEGDDLLDGGFDADLIDGGIGDDTLIPGTGPAVVIGGAGTDALVLPSLYSKYTFSEVGFSVLPPDREILEVDIQRGRFRELIVESFLAVEDIVNNNHGSDVLSNYDINVKIISHAGHPRTHKVTSDFLYSHTAQRRTWASSLLKTRIGHVPRTGGWPQSFISKYRTPYYSQSPVAFFVAPLSEIKRNGAVVLGENIQRYFDPQNLVPFSEMRTFQSSSSLESYLRSLLPGFNKINRKIVHIGKVSVAMGRRFQTRDFYRALGAVGSDHSVPGYHQLTRNTGKRCEYIPRPLFNEWEQTPTRGVTLIDTARYLELQVHIGCRWGRQVVKAFDEECPRETVCATFEWGVRKCAPESMDGWYWRCGFRHPNLRDGFTFHDGVKDSEHWSGRLFAFIGNSVISGTDFFIENSILVFISNNKRHLIRFNPRDMAIAGMKEDSPVARFYANLMDMLATKGSVTGLENVIGSTYSDLIYGDDLPNTLQGRDGNNQLHGRGGGDTLVGGLGDEGLFGGAGADVILPGGGFDYIDGGDDWDTVNFQSSPSGVSIDLRNVSLEFVPTTPEQSRTRIEVLNVEYIQGSPYNDHFIGDEQGNVFNGLEGNDWAQGMGGADTFLLSPGRKNYDGGEGIDWLVHGKKPVYHYVADASSRLPGRTFHAFDIDLNKNAIVIIPKPEWMNGAVCYQLSFEASGQRYTRYIFTEEQSLPFIRNRNGQYYPGSEASSRTVSSKALKQCKKYFGREGECVSPNSEHKRTESTIDAHSSREWSSAKQYHYNCGEIPGRARDDLNKCHPKYYFGINNFNLDGVDYRASIDEVFQRSGQLEWTLSSLNMQGVDLLAVLPSITEHSRVLVRPIEATVFNFEGNQPDCRLCVEGNDIKATRPVKFHVTGSNKLPLLIPTYEQVESWHVTTQGEQTNGNVFTNIEAFRGGWGDDVFHGDSRFNLFDTSHGYDVVNAGGGETRIMVGPGRIGIAVSTEVRSGENSDLMLDYTALTDYVAPSSYLGAANWQHCSFSLNSLTINLEESCTGHESFSGCTTQHWNVFFPAYSSNFKQTWLDVYDSVRKVSVPAIDLTLKGSSGNDVIALTGIPSDKNSRTETQANIQTLQGNDTVQAIAPFGSYTINAGTGSNFLDFVALNVTQTHDKGVYVHLSQGKVRNKGAGSGDTHFTFDIEGFNQVRGTTGDDEIHGSDDDDVIYGHSGGDRLFGYRGNDTFQAGLIRTRVETIPIVDGGADSDSLDFSQFNRAGFGADEGESLLGLIIHLDDSAVAGQSDLSDPCLTVGVKGSLRYRLRVEGCQSADCEEPSTVSDVYMAIWNIEHVIGSPYHDEIYGSLSSASQISGGKGHDRLYALSANTLLSGDTGDDMLSALTVAADPETGKGVTTLGGPGADQHIGSPAADTLIADQDADRLAGGDGIDTYWIKSEASGSELIDTDQNNVLALQGSGFTFDSMSLRMSPDPEFSRVDVLFYNSLLLTIRLDHVARTIRPDGSLNTPRFAQALAAQWSYLEVVNSTNVEAPERATIKGQDVGRFFLDVLQDSRDTRLDNRMISNGIGAMELRGGPGHDEFVRTVKGGNLNSWLLMDGDSGNDLITAIHGTGKILPGSGNNQLILGDESRYEIVICSDTENYNSVKLLGVTFEQLRVSFSSLYTPVSVGSLSGNNGSGSGSGSGNLQEYDLVQGRDNGIALSFSGNQYGAPIDNLNYPGGAITLAAWVYPESLVGNVSVITLGAEVTSQPVVLGCSGNGTSVYFSISFDQPSLKTKILSLDEGISTNGWTHLAATVDDQGWMKLYLNGERKGIMKGVSPWSTVRQQNLIGSVITGQDSGYSGLIQEVVVVDYAMDELLLRNSYDSLTKQGIRLTKVEKAAGNTPTVAPTEPASEAPLPECFNLYEFNNNQVVFGNTTVICSEGITPVAGYSYGDAVRFNSLGATIRVEGLNYSGNAFSFSAWIKSDSFVNGAAQVFQCSGGGETISLKLADRVLARQRCW